MLSFKTGAKITFFITVQLKASPLHGANWMVSSRRVISNLSLFQLHIQTSE
jgi:hypothetical protein